MARALCSIEADWCVLIQVNPSPIVTLSKSLQNITIDKEYPDKTVRSLPRSDLSHVMYPFNKR